MYECESWTIKKAERWRIDAFELWCWRRLESPSDCREIKPVNPKGNQSWIFIGRTHTEAEAPILATWCKELTHWKRPWCWEGLKAGGEGDNREWDGWMASLTQRTWVWASSRRWRGKGKPDMMLSMESSQTPLSGPCRGPYDIYCSSDLNPQCSTAWTFWSRSSLALVALSKLAIIFSKFPTVVRISVLEAELGFPLFELNYILISFF